MSRCVWPCFLLGVLQFPNIQIFNNFEFISAYGVRKYFNFIFLHVAVQFPWHCLMKRMSLLYCIFLPLLLYIDLNGVGLFLGSLVCSIDLYVCFCANTINILIIVAWQYSLKAGSMIPSAMFFSQDCFGYLWAFVFPYKFKNYLSCFCGKCLWYFDRGYIEPGDRFG